MQSRCVGAALSSLLLAACVGQVDPGPAGPRRGGEDTVECGSGSAIAPSDRALRLTYHQYDRAVSDLVGAPLAPSSELGGDPGDVFTRTLLDGLAAAARGAAARVTSDDSLFAQVIGCAPSGSADEAGCARDFIQRFGRRAYRRPLSSAELASYQALFDDRATLTETGSFREGVGVLVEAFLQSPGFLLRAERSTEIRDGRIPLSPFEIAQRLALALWGSVPDDALLDAAASGSLATPEEIAAQARRMLDDPRARDLVTREHRAWLGMDGPHASIWSNVRRDDPAFASVTDEDLHHDVLGTLEHLVFETDAGLRELLTSPVAVVNGHTAPLYGLTGTFDGWTPVELDPAERPGLLTRVGFLASHARSSRSSLIYRGAFVVRHLTCQTIGSPPAGAESTPLPDTAGLVTTRQRIDAMTSAGLCVGCHHSLVNPAGYALESFDELGRFRTTENGAAVDTTGTITLGSESIPYVDAASFGEALAGSSEVQRCYVTRWVEHVHARSAAPEDTCDIGALGDRLSEDGYSIRDLLVDLAQTDAFRSRAVVEVER